MPDDRYPLEQGLQGVVEGDTNTQAEAVVDRAIEQGRIAQGDRADWLTAIAKVGLAPVKAALAARTPDPVQASRAMSSVQEAHSVDLASRMGVKVEELI